MAQATLLLKLPAELRDAIYHYTLSSNGPINITTFDIKRATVLLQVCSQVRLECA